MSGLRMWGTSVRIRRIAVAGVLCLLLGLVWGLLPDRAEAQGKPAKPPSNKCNHLTAAVVFLDAPGDGIKSDGQQIYYVGYPDGYYGSPSEYHGWEDSLACLMMYDDWDFIMGTASTSFEKNGWNRKVRVDFGEQQVPFSPSDLYEVTIRSDYVYNVNPDQAPVDRRLILWFTANRIDYKLYFDDADGTDQVQVTMTGTTPDRVWTIVSSGFGRLEGPRKVGIVGYFSMPFQIKIYETGKPNTCL